MLDMPLPWPGAAPALLLCHCICLCRFRAVCITCCCWLPAAGRCRIPQEHATCDTSPFCAVATPLSRLPLLPCPSMLYPRGCRARLALP